MMKTLTMQERVAQSATMTRMLAMSLVLAAGGCVNVTAPSKPIEINLNISVTQQVVYRLDNQAKSLIQQNPGIF